MASRLARSHLYHGLEPGGLEKRVPGTQLTLIPILTQSATTIPTQSTMARDVPLRLAHSVCQPRCKIRGKLSYCARLRDTVNNSALLTDIDIEIAVPEILCHQHAVLSRRRTHDNGRAPSIGQTPQNNSARNSLPDNGAMRCLRYFDATTNKQWDCSGGVLL